MSQQLPVGMDNFEKIRQRNYYYIDKTSFIRILLQNCGEVNLFARPRRFGKTLNMSMLQAFFEAGKDQRHLFAGLEIMNEKDLCERYMNQYPVISLSLKDVEGKTFDEALMILASQVADECVRLSFLAQDMFVDEDYLRLFKLLKAQRATPQELAGSLKTLTRMLEAHYGHKVILLIDEYDVPLDKAFHKGYYDDMITFLRIFLGQALKTNSSLEFAVVTGCLRISRESIFTGVNNLFMNTITDKEYEEEFGFTDEEVRGMLDDYKLSSVYDDLREWYNGYRFGDTDIYCPWDIINHVAKLRNNPGIRPQSYWNNTSSNDMVKRFIDKADSTTRNEIEDLIAGKSVPKVIKETLTYGELDNSINNLWSVLFLTGYLTRTKNPMGLASEPIDLIIPNREVCEIFIEKIRDWFAEKLIDDEIQRELQRLCHAFLDGDCDVIEKILTNQLRTTISYFDNYEYYYHGFLIGLLLGCGSIWSIKSNRESGSGRSDLLIVTNDGSMGLVIEIKHARKQEDIHVLTQDALDQIKNRSYEDAFMGEGIQRLRSYGITFWKKTCEVKSRDIA
ncbi:MAG: ATP-binding protein [Peptococcaceae bacterium]|nr:ATP-binding protein [Peptococcaceae bacterium]